MWYGILSPNSVTSSSSPIVESQPFHHYIFEFDWLSTQQLKEQYKELRHGFPTV